MKTDTTRPPAEQLDAALDRGQPRVDSPAEVLGDLWAALDVLPEATSSPRLAATTVEMATVSVSRGRPPLRSDRAGGSSATRRWAVAGVIVAASLAAGFVTGTAGRGGRLPTPAETVVVIRHLDVLREAGSVAFLEAFAAGDFTPPPAAVRGWDGTRREPSEAAGAAPGEPGGMREPPESELVFPQLEAALADFRYALRRAGETSPQPAGADLEPPSDAEDSEESRRKFEANRISFRELPPSQRDDYKLLAEALVDPRRPELVEAAKRWHVWVAFADPVERAGLVDLPTSERLEWLARRQRQWRRFYQPGRPGLEGERVPFDRPGRPTGPRPSGGRFGDGPPRRGPGGPPWSEADASRGRTGVGGRGAAAVTDEDPLP